MRDLVGGRRSLNKSFYSSTILLLLSDIYFMSIVELALYLYYLRISKVLVSDMLNLSKVSSGSGDE